MRTGFATLLLSNNKSQPARLQLTVDSLYVQKEELVYTSSATDLVDPELLNQERTVVIKREKTGGLGLSVKGGAEHNLPILISRIFKDQAADKSGKLFVGDAISKVNDIHIESFTHDEAVTILKTAGDTVTLVVRYYQPALYLLSRGGKNSKFSYSETDNKKPNLLEMNGNSVYQPEKQFTNLVTVNLSCAYITRYHPNSAELRTDSFELVSHDHQSTAVLSFENTRLLDDWLQCIREVISTQNALSLQLTNKLLLPEEQLTYMCWITEKVPPPSASGSVPSWRRHFLSLKGDSIILYNSPPVKTKDWVTCEHSYKVYECMLRTVKSPDPSTLLYFIELDNGKTLSRHQLCVESQLELCSLERAWYKSTYYAVKQIGNKTFGCRHKDVVAGLTLDFNKGFCLYNSDTKSCIWSYKFSQLKGSSDDGQCTLQLQFNNETSGSIDCWEIQCTELRTLLYTIHAFLSARLAAVDPIYLINL